MYVDGWEWTLVSPMHAARRGHACGTVTHPGGEKEVVVVGGDGDGDGSVEVYSLATGTWMREEADFPGGYIEGAMSVPIENTFLVVGGKRRASENEIAPSTEAYLREAHTGSWLLLANRLETPRSFGAAMLVEGAVITCGTR